MSQTWRTLLSVNFQELSKTRKQVHQAIQNVSAVGRCLSPPSDYDEFGTLEWIPDLQRLAGKWIEGDVKFRSSLDFKDFSVHLVNERLIDISSVLLNEKRQGLIMVWLEEQVTNFGYNASDITLELPYEIPEYPQAKKEPFDISLDYLNELSKYFHNANLILGQLAKEFKDFGPVLTYPHHFDIATLSVLKDTGSPETSASINMGLSPGDETFEEPYFYINPWPYPEEEEMLPLEHGEWYFENWVGAVFKVSELLKVPEIHQQQRVVDFFREAFPVAVSTIR